MRLSELNRIAWEITVTVPMVKDKDHLKPLSKKKLREMAAAVEKGGVCWVEKVRRCVADHNDNQRGSEMKKFAEEFIGKCKDIDQTGMKTIFRYILWNVDLISNLNVNDIETCLRAEGLERKTAQDIISQLKDKLKKLAETREKHQNQDMRRGKHGAPSWKHSKRW